MPRERTVFQQALHSIFILGCILGSGLTWIPVFSAEPSVVPVEVVITESARLVTPLHESPFAASVVKEPLNNLQALGLDEALTSVPGVYAQNRQNAAQDVRIAIRGFGARSNFGVRGIKIMVDGVPHTLPDGQAQLDGIDLTSIDRIEVRRGSSSALYGNASGGVIDIRTKFDELPILSMQTAFGEFGYRNTALRAASKYKNLSAAANAARTRLNGYRAHSARETDLIGAQMKWQTAHGHWSLILNSLDAPLALDPGGLTKIEAANDRRQASGRNVLFDAGENVSQQKAAMTYQKDFLLGQLRTRAYVFDRDFANRLPFENGGAVELARTFVGAGVEWRGQLQTGWLNHDYVLGIDVDDQDDNRRRFDNLLGAIGEEVFAQNEYVRSTGIFAQTMINFNEATSIVLGARLDSVRFEVVDRFLSDGDDSGARTFDHVSPMIGASWEALPDTRLYANIATSFETPTTTELSNPNGGGFNPDLVPQSATNYEIGAKLQKENIDAAIALFHIRVKDELVPFEMPESPGRSFFRNAGRSTRSGLEASAKWRLQRYWLAVLAYTYSDFVFDQYRTDGNIFDGNQLPGIPRHLFNAQIKFQHPSGWFAAGDLRYIGSQFADDANTVSVDHYMSADIQAGIEKSTGDWRLKLYSGINNLTNENYSDNVRINAAGGRYFEPAPGRNIYAGLVVTRTFP